MIEDPKLTLRILQYIASDEISYPANVAVHDQLAKKFDEVDLPTLEYHVACAYRNDLLSGHYEEQQLFEGIITNFGYISGLTPKGGDYVRDAELTIWQDAWARIEQAGLMVTTDRLVEVVGNMAAEALRSL